MNVGGATPQGTTKPNVRPTWNGRLLGVRKGNPERGAKRAAGGVVVGRATTKCNATKAKAAASMAKAKRSRAKTMSGKAEAETDKAKAVGGKEKAERGRAKAKKSGAGPVEAKAELSSQDGKMRTGIEGVGHTDRQRGSGGLKSSGRRRTMRS